MRKVILAVALLCLPIIAAAVTSPMPYVKIQFLDNSGSPCAGCTLSSFSAGTSTPLATYTDASGLSQNTNPIVLDSAGRANIWLGANSYKFVLKDANGVTLWTVDNVTNSFLLSQNNTWTGTNTFNGAVVFNGSVTFSGASVIVAALNGDQYVLCAGTDDTAAFSTAISNVAAGGRVIPVGACKLAPASPGSQLILINKTMSLDCHGWGGSASANNVITIGSSVPGTTDVIRVAGGSTAIEGGGIYNCQFLPQSGTPARYGLNIDTTTYGISKFHVDHNFLGNFGSYGIKLTNPTLTDGFFGSWITHNEIYNGTNFQRLGDSVTFTDNVVTGNNIGFDATYVPGAMDTLIQHNNVTTLGACIHLGDAARYTRIRDNECEGGHGVVTGSNSAYVDIAGTVTNPALQVVIEGNTIDPVQSGIDGLRLDYTEAAVIRDNKFSRAGGGAHDIVITANTTAGTTHIGFNRYEPTTDTQSLILSDSSNWALAFWINPQATGGGMQINRTLYVGPNAGIISGGFSTSSSNPATTCIFCLAKSDKVAWRNNANSADLPLGIDGSDNLTYNANVFLSSTGTGNFSSIFARTPGSGSVGDATAPFQSVIVGSAANVYSALSTTATTNRSAILPDASGNITLKSAASVSHAVCWKTADTLGYCSDTVGAGGTCTCN